VGAAFNGEYYVGLGNTQQEAFEAYLQKLAGVVPSSTASKPEPGFDKEARIAKIKSAFEDKGLEIVTPTSLSIPLSFREGEVSLFSQIDTEATDKLLDEFLDEFVLQKTRRIVMWQDDDTVNIGVISTVEGVPELHYISVEVGK
jgi:hypothetical protein